MRKFVGLQGKSSRGEKRSAVANVRVATRKDIPALRQLCRAATGPRDYVLAYLDEMVGRRQIYVADEGGRLVAMMGVSLCLDRSLWLGQVRTHPAFRRQGYARLLFEAAARRARRERRPALRLWTSTRNVAAQRLARSAGFRRVAVFTRRVARPLGGPGALQATRRTDHALRLWQGSAFRRYGRGHIAYQWYFLPLTPPALRKIASRGEMLAGDDAAVVLYPEEGGRTAFMSVLAGKRAALTAVRRAAGERGYTSVEAFFPRDPHILRWARGAGFKRGSWGTRAVLYERRV